MIQDLIRKNRSYRRFKEDVSISRGDLEELVGLARISPSGGNAQPLKFFISNTPETNDSIFPHLKWAASLQDWDGPEPGERPSAYILVLLDTEVSKSPGHDAGIACQSMLLGAVEKGLGGCMLGSVERSAVKEKLNLPKSLDIVLVIALGTPAEQCVIEDAEDGTVTYYRTEDQVHHVPKRPMQELLVH